MLPSTERTPDDVRDRPRPHQAVPPITTRRSRRVLGLLPRRLSPGVLGAIQQGRRADTCRDRVNEDFDPVRIDAGQSRRLFVTPTRNETPIRRLLSSSSQDPLVTKKPGTGMNVTENRMFAAVEGKGWATAS